MDAFGLPARAGVFWLRLRVNWPDRYQQVLPKPGPSWMPDQPGKPVDAVGAAFAGSSELYWDGQLVWRNGRVAATRAAEVAGAIDVSALIPKERTGPGEHVVAMRISTHRYNCPGQSKVGIFLHLLNYDARHTLNQQLATFPLIAVGCALVSAVICVVLYWLVDRSRPLVWCGLCSGVVAVYYVTASWRVLSVSLFQPVPYDLIYPLSEAVKALMALIGGLILGTFLELFAVPRKRGWFAGLGLAFAVIWFVTWRGRFGDTAAGYLNPLYACRVALGLTAVAAGWAIYHKRPGAWLVLAACVIGLASVRVAVPMRQVLNPWCLITFVLLVVALVTTIGLRVQVARRAARAAELTAARMEIELVKKNLQPHFLMNTLAVLSEVVEQDPPTAARLIEDLADEFRTVARVSAEKLIPLSHEIELCRAHLRVMSVRTGRAWKLETSGVEATASVPPAIFLTLIENGFAHQCVTNGDTAFTLNAQRCAEMTRYTFVSPGELQIDAGRPAGGTGLRYVKARLEESFPGRWTLESERVAGGWRTTVELGGTEAVRPSGKSEERRRPEARGHAGTRNAE